MHVSIGSIIAPLIFDHRADAKFSATLRKCMKIYEFNVCVCVNSNTHAQRC